MNIQKRVYEHYQYVDNYNYTRFFTALQGSQNYGLADDESDIDTKTLIIPNYKELVFNAKPVSSTIIVEPTTEHADVKDIRLMFDTFRKQNINFLEILFTPYVVVTGGYKIYYHSLWNKREDIAHLNPYRNLSSMVGHMYEKYKKFEHPFPSAVSKIEKFGYDPKQLHHMVRIKDFLERFFEKGVSYEEALTHPTDPQKLIMIKRGLYSYNTAVNIKEETYQWAIEFKEKWSKKLVDQEDAKTNDFMNNLMYDIIKETHRNEFQESFYNW